MKIRWGGMLFVVGLVVIANIGALWFGKWFRIALLVLTIAAYVVSCLLIRHRKTELVRKLSVADRETQDAALAQLDADDRKEILRRLGRDDA